MISYNHVQIPVKFEYEIYDSNLDYHIDWMLSFLEHLIEYAWQNNLMGQYTYYSQLFAKAYDTNYGSEKVS